MWPNQFLSSDGYPMPAFRFRVMFVNPLNGFDTSFQSVSGLGSTIEYMDVQEGGKNESGYALPKSVKRDPLVLKRGISSPLSGFFLWITKIMATDFSMPITPRMLHVHLLDERGLPRKIWHIDDALPLKWSVDEFNSTSDKVAIETIELKYTKAYRII